jgi:hypothetical protein
VDAPFDMETAGAADAVEEAGFGRGHPNLAPSREAFEQG